MIVFVCRLAFTSYAIAFSDGNKDRNYLVQLVRIILYTFTVRRNSYEDTKVVCTDELLSLLQFPH